MITKNNKFIIIKQIINLLNIIFAKNKAKLLIIIIYFLIQKQIRISSNLKILICTIAKQENKYINEFVEHYRRLKIKAIIIYDNNDINGEKFDDILKNDINNHFIKIINIRGIKHPQIMVINDCYQNYNKSYDWIAFYDIDEFLYINHFHNLNKLYYEPKPLKQRFIKAVPELKIKSNKYLNSAAKTIVRGGLKIIINWGLFPHYIKNVINCRPDGNITTNYFSHPQHSIAYIKHYLTKSTEEFIERINRGDVHCHVNINYIKDRINKYYFLFNKKTKEKLNLFQQKIKYNYKIQLLKYIK